MLIALENEPYPHDRRVRQEAEALRAEGYEVTVCSPTGFGFDALREDVDGVAVRRFRAPPGGRGVAGYVREYGVSLVALHRLMRGVARERAVDVVVVCTPPDLLVLPALALRRRGAALVFDHHDLSPELLERKFGPRPVLRRLLEAIEAFALRRSDAVIASNAVYADIDHDRGGVPRERIFVVRNGPDPARLHPVEPRPELRRGRRHLVCWTGMIHGSEGLEHLLGAAEVLAGRRDDVTFAVVGPGDGRDRLIAEARRRGLAGVFDFPGRAGDELLREYLSTADVCVSTYEPNPMNHASTVTKVMEYMAVGRPIVQFPLRETMAACGDACLYVPFGDDADLADGIEQLLDDPQRREELGERARTRALAGLTWPAQVPALLQAVAAARERRARTP